MFYINYTVTRFIKDPLFRRKASFKVQIMFSHKCNFLLHEDLPCVHQLYMKNANRKTNGNVVWCKPTRCFIMCFFTWLFVNIRHIWKQIIQPNFHGPCVCNMQHSSQEVSLHLRPVEHLFWALQWCNPVTICEHS